MQNHAKKHHEESKHLCSSSQTLNKEITSDIHTHKKKPMEGTSRCTLGSLEQRIHYFEDHTLSITEDLHPHSKRP